jgi:hypothetical protein
MTFLTGGKRRLLLLATATVALIGAGVAYATIPGSDGVIHSCYNAGSNPSGQLRVIDPASGATCAKNERALNFNQTGPKGDPGIPGTPGSNGTNGTNGRDGTDGANGANGTNGTNGVSGYEVVSSSGDISSDPGSLTATCPAGKHVLGGGAELSNFTNGGNGAAVTGGRPLVGNVGWEATTERVFTWQADDAFDRGNDYFLTVGPYVTMQVWAICATTN